MASVFRKALLLCLDGFPGINPSRPSRVARHLVGQLQPTGQDLIQPYPAIIAQLFVPHNYHLANRLFFRIRLPYRKNIYLCSVTNIQVSSSVQPKCIHPSMSQHCTSHPVKVGEPRSLKAARTQMHCPATGLQNGPCKGG